MSIVSKALIAAIVSIAAYGVGKLVNLLLVRPMFWPLRHLPGPKSPSLIFGNMNEIMKGGPGEVHEDWVEKYGNTLTYKAFFNVRYLR